MVDRHPELAAYRPFTLFAVGQDYVHGEHPLRAGDELCLFPPVSGGSEAGDLYEVVDHPLSADAITVAVDHPGAGGVVVFSGVVRNETDGRPVKFLEYEAHPPMAVSKMQEIGSAALMSRALAGIARGRVVFVLPGSRAAVRLALERLVLPELGHLAAEAVKTR